MVLADESVYPHPGRVAFTDRNVDPTTGTLLVEAAFPNPEKLIRPGQFAKVRAPVEMRRGAILVPQRAVVERQAVFNVAVIAPADTIEMRRVKPGPRIGKLWVIDEGIAAGDRVVVEGVQKVRPGMKVNAVAAPADSVPATAPEAGAKAGGGH
jgi:membrane fusion protein (multidrug efflux system)